MVAVRLTPPVPDPVTVMSSMTLPVPKLVVAPVASRALAPVVVMVMVAADGKLTVPALVSATPVPPVVVTVMVPAKLTVPALVSAHTGAAGGGDGEVGDVEGAAGGVELDPAGAAGHDEVVEGAGDVAGAAFDGFGARPGAGDATGRVTVLPSSSLTLVEVSDGRRVSLPVYNVAASTTRLTAEPSRRLVGEQVDTGVADRAGVAGGPEHVDRLAGAGRRGVRRGERVERCLGASVTAGGGVGADVPHAAGERDGHACRCRCRGVPGFWSLTV